MQQVTHDWAGRLYLLLLLGLGVLLVTAPLVAPYDPMSTGRTILQPPGSDHPLGTDGLGRDVLSRLLVGGQRTMWLAGGATVLAVGVGLVWGMLLGLLGSWCDRLGMLLINLLLALPPLIIAMVIITLLGRGTPQLALAVGVSQIAPVARVIRAVVLTVRVQGYVEAARALGANGWQVAYRHVLPNVQPTLLAYTVITFSYSILNSAALSFLGLGGAPGVPDWGAMLAEGRTYFDVAPWISIFPGMAITLVVLLMNVFVDRFAR